ncbi:hypothetical protein L3X38_039867 [Prunus dulcis]|uniref:Uncharacterized protein n=1 Tax=Prunus dulcis TaxID=3755 RepID=A0AAD4V7Y4_PRUDU|nr:hypothetical protein L3X38_039867 [Prunus dulcis]
MRAAHCAQELCCAQALHSCTAAQQFAPLGHFIEHLARVNLGGSNGGFHRLQGSIDHPCSSVDPPLTKTCLSHFNSSSGIDEQAKISNRLTAQSHVEELA